MIPSRQTQRGFYHGKAFSTVRESSVDNVRADSQLINDQQLEPQRSVDIQTRSTSEHCDVNVSAESREEQAVRAKLEHEEANHDKDLTEVKIDTAELFDSVWRSISKRYEYMSFPSEIIWLNGAPGSGKSTNTPFILQARGLNAQPIIMSDLLSHPSFKERIDRGDMISDADVLERLLCALLDPKLQKGVLVDGFPRTTAQVEALTLLYDKMKELRSNCDARDLSRYPKPRFFIAVLYVSEAESIRRQFARGERAKQHNLRVRETHYGEFIDERETDRNEELCRKRYAIFRKHRDTLARLQDRFPFKVIDAEMPLGQVQAAILEQFKYQSAQELRPETYDTIQRVPLAESIRANARPELVERLDQYEQLRPDLFHRAVGLVNQLFIPKVRRNAFAGAVLVRLNDARINFDTRVVDMILDVLSERGYHCRYDCKRTMVPIEVDRKTMRIITEERVEHMFYLKYPEAALPRNT